MKTPSWQTVFQLWSLAMFLLGFLCGAVVEHLGG